MTTEERQEDFDDVPSRGLSDDWLGRRVKVFPATDREAGGQPFVEGRIIAYTTEPTITVEDDEGKQTSWIASLPIRFLKVEWKRPT
jgi:hypothetical protein